MPRTYTDEDGTLHVESDGVNDPQIAWRWRIVHDEGPWHQRAGRELRWTMTDEEAANWARTNPQTKIEKVPGSEQVRLPLAGWGCPPGPQSTV